MKEARATADLLTLIGHAINQLQRCVTRFEASEQESGLRHIATVIEEIDRYLEASDEDPLLRLASLPKARVREGLLDVRTDLASVIDTLREGRA
ncbi:hypothetical protein ACFLTM_01030 [Candidatus Bipolaricaulota bacterium]